MLCTIHQPSAILFQEFDRLLFLAKGGRTVYFGDIGKNSQTLLEYFESSGARKCGDEENPAEYMLEIVNKGNNDQGLDWHDVWKKSNLFNVVNQDIDRLHQEKQHEEVAGAGEEGAHDEFAMSFTTQLVEVTKRVFQQYWRMPSYISAKFILGIAAGLFIGFTFYGANSTQAGMQNVMFAAFMLVTIFTTFVQQVSSEVRRTHFDLPLTQRRSNLSSSRNDRCTRFANDLAKHTRGKHFSSPTSLSRFHFRS